eukprot:gnl/TRDRNA2_/TRDRNA2_163092_c1_seq1.p1 gnl/TRDRNA2_/TRDRNA2_163092_c1~~gnl/TRDRNA2_/TRDRNA2_163092_c1_seq1.p1  ORF type:complete len:552 (-),score=149.25 gnl/TRDRNA2_/TRDRNA2_163092_c1_seq1:198-1853(-)
MKVQVTLKVAAQKEVSDPTSFDVVINDADTVSSVKERIATAQLVAFPDHDLVLDGKVLEDGHSVLDCGVKDGSSLDFVIKASEATLIQQLSELLQARDLSSDELGLLYCYKHGVSVNQTLKLLGHNEKYLDFLKSTKPFLVDNGRVTLVRKDTALKPFSVVDEVKKILEANTSGSMEIPALCAKFVQKFNVSLESIAGMRPTDFLVKERNTFVVTGPGRRHVSLKSASRDKPRREAPASLQPSSWALEPSDVAEQVEDPAEAAEQNQQYLDLHNKICGRAFNSKVSQALNDIMVAVKETSFLNIHHVVKGGSVGKGTALEGVTDAELILFLNAMPPTGQDKWLPGVLKALAGGLAERLSEQYNGAVDIKALDDYVFVHTKDLITVNIRVSPVYDSYAQVIQVLAEQGPAARRHAAASLAEEKAHFIEKQPASVRMTIRLLKWWREQQDWSCALTKPTDEILELLAVYSATQTKPADQNVAVKTVMSLLARFDELRIFWPAHYYKKEDIWAPLLNQRPLLMDPTNPFVNVADPQAFDARELMALASSTHFFW